MSISSQKILQNAAASAVVTLGVIIPVKFGSLVLPNATEFFQGTGAEWVIGQWANSLFGALAGMAALLAAVAYPALSWRRPEGKVAGLFAGAVILAFCGAYNADNLHYSQVELAYLVGLALWGTAVAILLANRRGFGVALLKAWFAGMVLVICWGLYQYFYGFDQLLEYIRKERESGRVISTVIEAKIAARRVHAPFDLPNSLAGFLLLSIASFVWSPPPRNKVLDYMAFGFFLLVWGFVLAKTGSRAAFVSLAAAAMLFALLLEGVKKRPWLRLSILAVGILCAVAVIFHAKTSERGLGSLQSRIDYAKTAMRMAAEHPIAGGGWGEFHFNYMRDKSDGTEEAPRAPHNMFLSFASQAGVPSAILLLLAVGYPIFLAFKSSRHGVMVNLMAAALFGYLLHSCADVNLQVPACSATMLTAALLLAHYAPRQPKGAPPPHPRWKAVAVTVVAAATATQIFEVAASWRFYRFSENPTPLAAAAALKLQPQNAVIPLRLGYRLARGREFAAALEQFNRAAELSPRDPDPWVAMMELELKRHDAAAAEKALNEARKRFPRNWLFKGAPEEVAAKLQKARGLK